ncbi:MAG TPA: hypothetical protein VG889_13015 [Rhizomicrobium sp.]|nr:hypothetical protein [Rhizomicrobium sp.]
MKFKSFALGGAAIVGLAVATLPAAAYTHHPSTPAERKQTDDLNAQSLQQAQGQSTQTATPDQSQQMSQQAAPQTNDRQAMNTAPSAAPTGTVESGPSGAAEGAAQPTETQQAQATQTNAQAKSNAQMQTAAEGGMATAAASGTVSLAQISNPPQTLANASVETSNGQAVGAVQKVVTDGGGKATSVDVALLGPQSKIVAIDANQLAFDQSRNVVVAQLSADQIQALPPAPQG